MALELTEKTRLAADETTVEPELVLEIDGLPTLFGAAVIKKYVEYGDDVKYGDPGLVYGGLISVEDQKNYVSFSGGTSTSINQQLRPDQGNISSISSLAVSLIDKNQEVSQVISPGVLLTDILGRKAICYFGFRGTGFPDDFIVLFRGIIDDVESAPGLVTINLTHPDNKKRQEIFQLVDTNASANILIADTTISLVSSANLLQPVLGPDGVTYDPAIKFYVRIEDEIIRYTGISGNQLTGCTRGQLGTTAAAHPIDTQVQSFYVLEGPAMDLAQKIMLSGWSGPFKQDVQVTNFNVVGDSSVQQDSIYFADVDLELKYGITAGDYITTTGASNGANNVSNKVINSVIKDGTGSYILIAGVTFVNEVGSSALVDFRSKYDTLGEGLKMSPDEVDVAKHEELDNLYLGTSEYRFYLKETMKAKDFLDQQIYGPYGAYSLPRKGRASVGITIGPIPTEEIKTISKANIRNPKEIKLKRTINRHFYNTIVHKFDQDVLEDKFLSGIITVNEDSKNRIPVGNKVRTFEAQGLRSDQNGAEFARQASERMLARYKFAAEYFENIKVFFKDGFNSEPGDLVIFDFENLQVTNSEDGTRDKPQKFYEILNRSINIKNGDIVLSLVDTNYEARERYGLISPSSLVATGSTTTEIIIQDSFGILYPGDEKRKWEDYIGLPIVVHNEDWSYQEETILNGFAPNNRYKMLVDALSGAPTAGMIVDIPYYPDDTNKKTNRLYKLYHAHFSPRVTIAAGVSVTEFTVGAGDIAKFFIGSFVQVHDTGFTAVSDELEVVDIVGNNITVASTMGFTPSAGYEVDFIGFKDQESAYRFI